MNYIIGWNWSFLFIVSTTLLYGFTLTGMLFTGNYLQQHQIEFVVLTIVYFVYISVSLIGVDLPVMTQPLIMIWFLSYLVFSFKVVGSMIFNKNSSAINLIVGMIMYFTYSQLFFMLLFRAIYSISRLRGKTKRYKEELVQ